MTEVVEKIGTLILLGKRIIGTTTQDVVVEVDGEAVTPVQPSHIHRDEHVPGEREITNAMVSLETVETFYDKYEAMSYYDSEANEIKAMRKFTGKVDKTVIQNDGKEFVTFTVKTDESMDIHINHTIASEGDAYSMYKLPVNGKIVVTISSNLVGTMRISAIGETQYTEGIEVSVEGGIEL